MNPTPLAAALHEVGLLWPHVMHRCLFVSWHVAHPALRAVGITMLWERR